MHFSTSTVLVLAASLCGTGLAAPAAKNAEHRVSHVVGDLDKDGKIDWVEAGGGRFAVIPNDKMAAYNKRDDLVARDDKDITVAKKPTHVHCWGRGDMMWTSVIIKAIPNACEQLVKNSAAGQAVEGAWNVFKQFGVVNKAREATDIYFAWQWEEKYSTQSLTTSLCRDLIKAAFEPKKGHCARDEDTHGGEITWADQIKLIVDPNSDS